MNRGTVTHAASTTESAERASVTATKAGRVNTAPSVRLCDTLSTYTHALDRRTTEEIHIWAGLKGHLWSVNVSWKDTDPDALLLQPTDQTNASS